MSSSNTSTYNQTPPHRPSLDELGGGAKVVPDGMRRPDPVRQLTPEDFNQVSQQLAGLALVSAIAILLVDQSAGTYSKQAVSGQPAAAVLSAFTVTKNGTGDITVSWTAGIFPAPLARPRVHVVGATPLLSAVESLTSISCRIRFLSHAGAPTDASFDLEIF